MQQHLRPGSHLGSWIRPQPYSRLLIGLPQLADPLVPVPPPHSPVHRVPCLLKLPPTGALLRPIRRQQNFLVGLDGPPGLPVRRWRTLWRADRMGIRRKWIRITKLIEEVHLNLQWEKEVLVIQLGYRSDTGHGRGGYDSAESYRYRPRFWTLLSALLKPRFLSIFDVKITHLTGVQETLDASCLNCGQCQNIVNADHPIWIPPTFYKKEN